MKNIRLGDLLIELGYITPDQLTAALAYQKEHRDLRVGQALQELGYVNAVSYTHLTLPTTVLV